MDTQFKDLEDNTNKFQRSMFIKIQNWLFSVEDYGDMIRAFTIKNYKYIKCMCVKLKS